MIDGKGILSRYWLCWCFYIGPLSIQNCRNTFLLYINHLIYGTVLCYSLLSGLRNPKILIQYCFITEFCFLIFTEKLSKQSKMKQNHVHALNIEINENKSVWHKKVFSVYLPEIEFLIEVRIWCKLTTKELQIKSYHPIYDSMSQRKTFSCYQSQITANPLSQLHFLTSLFND